MTPPRVNNHPLLQGELLAVNIQKVDTTENSREQPKKKVWKKKLTFEGRESPGPFCKLKWNSYFRNRIQ
jgi:hypothetical protein